MKQIKIRAKEKEAERNIVFEFWVKKDKAVWLIPF